MIGRLIASIASVVCLEVALALSLPDDVGALLGNRESFWESAMCRADASAESADVVFLGDSTVRVAIDEDRFEQETGLRTINLGLTGDLVTYGDYAALKRYLDSGRMTKMVVVWHTFDVWPRSLDEDLFLFTNPSWKDAYRVYVQHNVADVDPAGLSKVPVTSLAFSVRRVALLVPSYRYRSAIRRILGCAPPNTWLSSRLPRESVSRRTIPQQIAKARKRAYHISRDSMYWFERLIKLCRKHGVRVCVSRSPIHREFLLDVRMAARLRELNTELSAMFNAWDGVDVLSREHLTFADEQGCGDKDHVGDAGREMITMRYSQLVLELL